MAAVVASLTVRVTLLDIFNISIYIYKSQDLFEPDKDERGQTGGIREVHGGRGGLHVAKADMIGNVGVRDHVTTCPVQPSSEVAEIQPLTMVHRRFYSHKPAQKLHQFLSSGLPCSGMALSPTFP